MTVRFNMTDMAADQSRGNKEKDIHNVQPPSSTSPCVLGHS